jgi:hypothetical protein
MHSRMPSGESSFLHQIACSLLIQGILASLNRVCTMVEKRWVIMARLKPIQLIMESSYHLRYQNWSLNRYHTLEGQAKLCLRLQRPCRLSPIGSLPATYPMASASKRGPRQMMNFLNWTRIEISRSNPFFRIHFSDLNKYRLPGIRLSTCRSTMIYESSKWGTRKE